LDYPRDESEMALVPAILHIKTAAVAAEQQLGQAGQRRQFPVHEIASGLQLASVEILFAAFGVSNQGAAGNSSAGSSGSRSTYSSPIIIR
jgi:hypothetical protein